MRLRGVRTRVVLVALAAVALGSCAKLTEPLPSHDTVTAATDDPSLALADEEEFVVWAESFTPLEPDFDPFSATVSPGIRGAITESLYVFHRGAALGPEPMLGVGAEFNEAGTELKVTIRQGVTWSDGQPLTPGDVASSYLHEPGKLDYVTDARVDGDDTLTLYFSGVQFAQRAEILQQPIVAQHAESGEVLGTGPFILDAVTETSYSMTANPAYWRGGAPQLPRVSFLAVKNRAESNELLTTNAADWVSLFSPDAERIASYGYFSVANERLEPLVMYTCANANLGCQGAQTEPAVRRALDAAIDRAEIRTHVFGDYAHPASPALTLLGESDPWLTDAALAQSPDQADHARTSELLQEAGYTLNPAGIFEKDGQELRLRLGAVEEWADHLAIADLIAEQAARAGIAVEIEPLPWEEFAQARQSGEFELIIGGMLTSPDADPLLTYATWFGGQATAPVGSDLAAGTWNVARYVNEDVDAAIHTAAATEDRGEKLTAYATIQQQIAVDLPYLPLLIAPAMSFYNTLDYAGWPSAADPFAFTAPWESYSVGLVLSSLRPVP